MISCAISVQGQVCIVCHGVLEPLGAAWHASEGSVAGEDGRALEARTCLVGWLAGYPRSQRMAFNSIMPLIIL